MFSEIRKEGGEERGRKGRKEEREVKSMVVSGLAPAWRGSCKAVGNACDGAAVSREGT